MTERRIQAQEAHQAAYDNETAAAEAREQLTLVSVNDAEEVAELKSHMATARATLAGLCMVRSVLERGVLRVG